MIYISVFILNKWRIILFHLKTTFGEINLKQEGMLCVFDENLMHSCAVIKMYISSGCEATTKVCLELVVIEIVEKLSRESSLYLNK